MKWMQASNKLNTINSPYPVCKRQSLLACSTVTDNVSYFIFPAHDIPNSIAKSEKEIFFTD